MTSDRWLTSHLMKTLERLFLSLLRPQVQHALDRLQFGYQPDSVEDAILMLQDTCYTKSTPIWIREAAQ